MAYLTRLTEQDRFDAAGRSWQVEGRDRSLLKWELLNHYKLLPEGQDSQFLAEVAAACKVARPDGRGLFLGWKEAAEMAAGGMEIGAHTHTHCVLASQSIAKQREELRRCRDILGERLGQAPLALAYPVGAQNSFSSDTENIARETGYKMAFSFHGGWNRAQQTNFMNISRWSVCDMNPVRFRFSTALAAHSRRWWI